MKTIILEYAHQKWEFIAEIVQADYVFVKRDDGSMGVLKDRSGKLGSFITREENPELFL